LLLGGKIKEGLSSGQSAVFKSKMTCPARHPTISHLRSSFTQWTQSPLKPHG